jgi:hypothetical protein
MRVAPTLAAVFANNDYDLTGAKRLLDDLEDEKLAFVEELFPNPRQQQHGKMVLAQASAGCLRPGPATDPIRRYRKSDSVLRLALATNHAGTSGLCHSAERRRHQGSGKEGKDPL